MGIAYAWLSPKPPKASCCTFAPVEGLHRASQDAKVRRGRASARPGDPRALTVSSDDRCRAHIRALRRVARWAKAFLGVGLVNALHLPFDTLLFLRPEESVAFTSPPRLQQ